jgi:hypothetical protein
MKILRTIIVLVLLIILFPSVSHAANTTGYAWGSDVGWIDTGTATPAPAWGVNVSDTALTGYMYGENIGWISLNCLNTDSCANNNYAVTHNGHGILSGYAWAENSGWIDFSGVTIGTTTNVGQFSGYAYGENVKWISLNCLNTNSCGTNSFAVSTSWRMSAPPPTSHSISGKVKYFNQSKAIPSVNVILRNSSNVQVATTLTDTSGNYQFTNIPGGVSYTLRVATTSVMTGVNNADQTIVRKYILGRPIVAPVLTNYAFIKVAGDVNSNGALNQNDQNSIRSLVLRQILSDGTTIPANALWKFFDSSATVTPSNYLQPALNIRTLTNLSTNLTGQDFIGVMTGDASGNW